MRMLATWDAQRRVVFKEWGGLSGTKQQCWQTILVACATPGIPIEDPAMLEQLQELWGKRSVTLRQLCSKEFP